MSGPSPDLRHDEWAALAVGYAMDALEPEDEQALLAHLPGCEVCAGVVADTRMVMGHLAYAVAPAEPPPSVLAGIRAGIAAGEQESVEPAPVSTLPRRRVHRPAASRWIGVAAALALLVGLSVWNVVLQAENRSQQRRLAQASLVTGCLREVGCRTVELRSPGSDRPRATALVRPQRVQLVVTGLPRNDRDAEVYVLWQQGADNRLAALSSFDITRSEPTVIDAPLTTSRSALTGLAVSREPGRTSPATPTEIVAVGALSG